MSRQADGTAFTQAFLIGAGCGLLSLGFLARMPKPSPARKALRPGEAVGWRAAFSERRFFKLIGLNVALMLVVGSLNVFAVQFLRDVQGFSPESILYLSAIMFLGPLASLSLLGKWTDRRWAGACAGRRLCRLRMRHFRVAVDCAGHSAVRVPPGGGASDPRGNRLGCLQRG